MIDEGIHVVEYLPGGTLINEGTRLIDETDRFIRSLIEQNKTADKDRENAQSLQESKEQEQKFYKTFG